MPIDAYDELRKACEGNLVDFIKVVAPYAVMAHCHEDFSAFLDNEDEHYKLGLMPRAHRKSFLMAMKATQLIIKNPAATILYRSATANLAETQLRIIKSTLLSPIIKKLYPDLIKEQEGQRAKWTTSEIVVDHPKRLKEGTRDSTIRAIGLTTTITGGHYDYIFLDDLVASENNNVAGRKSVSDAYSQMHSILNPGGYIFVAGTRYHPKDLYGILMETMVDIYDNNGLFITTKPQWAVYQRVVEIDGEFLWPREIGPNGVPFGFDSKVLATTKAGYQDKTQFYAQYYNDPKQQGASLIHSEYFRYYDRALLKERNGQWYYGKDFSEVPLDVYASMDFAYSLSKKADSSVIAVVGIDVTGQYRILELDRFKTNVLLEYYEHARRLHSKWHFKKLRLETNAAQEVIARQMQYNFKHEGINLNIEEFKAKGDKDERIMNILRLPYEKGQIEHYRGGNCELLEEELLAASPPHDDLKDALSGAIEIAKIPTVRINNNQRKGPFIAPSRFGGSH